jgi:hypothetical protein
LGENKHAKIISEGPGMVVYAYNPSYMSYVVGIEE